MSIYTVPVYIYDYFFLHTDNWEAPQLASAQNSGSGLSDVWDEAALCPLCVPVAVQLKYYVREHLYRRPFSFVCCKEHATAKTSLDVAYIAAGRRVGHIVWQPERLRYFATDIDWEHCYTR